MKRNKLICSASIILAMLIVMMPVSFAQMSELTLTRYSGSQTNKNGYYRPDEGMALEALASSSIDPNGIQADQLRLYIDGTRNLPFQTCELQSGIQYKCSLSASTTPAAGTHQLQVRMYQDADKFAEGAVPIITRTAQFTADSLGGQATDILVVPGETKDGRMQIRWTAIDRALPYTPQGVCAGIDKVELLLDDINAAPFSTTQGDGTCRMQGVQAQTFSGLSNGVHTIIVKVTDKFGQVGPLAPTAFLMDNTVPGVQPGTATVTDSDTGATINFVRSSVVTFADVQIKLTKANMTVANVRADFRSMTTIGGYEDRAADLAQDYTYTWRRVPLLGMTSCNILMKATDSLGNTASSTAPCSVLNDDIGPAVAAIETGVKDTNNTYYIGKNGTLFITFTDSGIGLNATTAFAGLGEVIGRSPAPATACDANGNTYRCRWDMTPTRPDGIKTLTAHRSTTDLLGNPLQAEASLKVTLDTVNPIITSVTQRLVEGPSGGMFVPVRGSNIEFTLNGTGFDPGRVTVNLTGLGGDAAAQMACSGNSCTAVTGISVSGPLDARVTFIASDSAGNAAKTQLVVPVAGILNATPAYWENNARCSPLIDRSTTTLIQQKLYCDSNLQTSNPWAKPIAINFPGINSCTGDISKLISNIDGINMGTSLHPTFGLTLYTAEYNYNQLSVTCPLEIMTMINQSGKIMVTPYPEIENVTMQVGFYNLPLSEMDKNIKQQVDDAIKDAKENLKWIGTLEKFFDLASKICNLKVVITNLIEGFNAIKNLFGAGALTSLPGTPTREVLKANYVKFCAAEQKASAKHENMLGFLDKLCDFVNCRSSQEDATGSGAGSYLAKLGGGAAHCKSVQATLGALGGANGLNIPDVQNKYTYLGGAGASIDIKNSLIMSSVCLCVPGIIHNVNKMREIKCQYALCMLREVKDGGLPPSYCKDLESYEYCNFLVGDAFSILPIFRLWDQTMNILKNVFANPFEAIPVLIGLKCKDMCDSPEKLAAHNSCMIPKTLAKIGDAIGSVRSIKNLKDYITPGAGGFCEQLDKLVPDTNSTSSSTSVFGGLIG
ncbi:MAG: hypothetical protein AABX47_00155 [Nanoarchaeota archaeon]